MLAVQRGQRRIPKNLPKQKERYGHVKLTITGLSNARLEQEIARCYWSRYEEARNHYFRTGRVVGTGLKETGTLALLWDEFDARMEAGTIEPETDWEADD